MDTANNILEYYGSIESSDSAQDRENKLKAALEAELAKNVVMVDETIPQLRGGWRLPLLLLCAALALSSLGLAFALVKYNVEMETIFFRPTPFFSTEALLIEALKKRTDQEISKRDQMIAEYRRRSVLREEVQAALPVTDLAPVQKEGQSVGMVPSAIEVAEDNVLVDLRRQADLEAFYARRLEQSLMTASRQMDLGDLAGATETMTILRASLLQKAQQDSPMIRSASAVAAAAISVIAALESKSGASEPATIVYVDNPAQDQALKRLRAENIALLDRIVALEGRESPPPVVKPASVSGPSGAFIGTVALFSGTRVLVDLAQGAEPRAGDLVEIYGTDDMGAAVLLTEGAVTAVRNGTAQLTVTEAKGHLSIRDTVYLAQRDR